jgi:chitosanase
MSVATLTRLQIETIDALIGTFEAPSAFNYAAMSSKDSTDPGGLSFGKHQAAFVPGKLHELMCQYAKAAAADGCDPDLQEQVRKILPRLKTRYPQLKDKAKNAKKDPERKAERLALLADEEVRELLQKTAADPGMRVVQDRFFHDGYMKRTLKAWGDKGFQYALSAAVAHDSCIQSGEPFDYIPSFAGDPRTVAGVAADQAVGPATRENEKEWVKAYVAGRKKWLSESSSEFTRNSVYRCEVFERLMAEGNWDLTLPVVGHGYEISVWDNFPEDAFVELKCDPVRRGDFSAFGEFRRAKVKEGRLPPWNGRGYFVRNCLTVLGMIPREPAKAGRFDAACEKALIAFQEKHEIDERGFVGEKTFDKLCDETSVVLDDRRRRSAPGSADGLTYIAPTTRKKTPALEGVAAVGVGAATTAGAVVLSETNASEASQESATLEEAVKASPTPEAAGKAVEAATVGVKDDPAILGMSTFQISTVAICIGFVAAIWIGAIFFRRNSE